MLESQNERKDLGNSMRLGRSNSEKGKLQDSGSYKKEKYSIRDTPRGPALGSAFCRIQTCIRVLSLGSISNVDASSFVLCGTMVCGCASEAS